MPRSCLGDQRIVLGLSRVPKLFLLRIGLTNDLVMAQLPLADQPFASILAL